MDESSGDAAHRFAQECSPLRSRARTADIGGELTIPQVAHAGPRELRMKVRCHGGGVTLLQTRGRRAQGAGSTPPDAIHSNRDAPEKWVGPPIL